jgi:hypothetical protein
MSDDSPAGPPADDEPTPAEYADEAARLEREAQEHPDDAEFTLIPAAEAWMMAGEHERALGVLDRILADTAVPHLIRAMRLDPLWHVEGEAAARAAAAELRSEKPDDHEAWFEASRAFGRHGDQHAALEWLNAGITHFLGPSPEVDVDVLADAGPDLYQFFDERRAIRQALGLEDDAWDDATADLAKLPLVGPEGEGLLDLGAPGSAFSGPDFDEEHDFEETPSGAVKLGFLHWPEDQLAELARRWPETAEGYGEDYAEHRRIVERRLRETSTQGSVALAVATANVEELVAYAEEHGSDPTDGEMRSYYAAEKTRRGEATPWPPERNAPCWCGSERKYKKCCGNPGLR